MTVTACHTPPCGGHAIVDPDAHRAWHEQIREQLDAPPAYGDVILEWLDTLDTSDVERAAFAGAGMDDNLTAALFAELRRRAEALA